MSGADRGSDTDLLRRAHELLAARTTDDRHAHTEDPADPSTVQAMQIALNIPKADVPARTALLEAAAQAVVRVCLDGRVITDEHWRRGVTDWYDHLIRKVARRARNKQWDDVQELPGVTVEVDGAQARAFVPSAVSEVDPLIRKLQIRGTELPADEPGDIDPGVPAIAIDVALEMSVGKAAAQVGHGAMLLAARQPFSWVEAWAGRGFPLQVREISHERLRELSRREGAVIVRDAGFTEVAPDSVTVVAVPGQSA